MRPLLLLCLFASSACALHLVDFVHEEQTILLGSGVCLRIGEDMEMLMRFVPSFSCTTRGCTVRYSANQDTVFLYDNTNCDDSSPDRVSEITKYSKVVTLSNKRQVESFIQERTYFHQTLETCSTLYGEKVVEAAVCSGNTPSSARTCSTTDTNFPNVYTCASISTPQGSCECDCSFAGCTCKSRKCVIAGDEESDPDMYNNLFIASIRAIDPLVGIPSYTTIGSGYCYKSKWFSANTAFALGGIESFTLDTTSKKIMGYTTSDCSSSAQDIDDEFVSYVTRVKEFVLGHYYDYTEDPNKMCSDELSDAVVVETDPYTYPISCSTPSLPAKCVNGKPSICPNWLESVSLSTSIDPSCGCACNSQNRCFCAKYMCGSSLKLGTPNPTPNSNPNPDQQSGPSPKVPMSNAMVAGIAVGSTLGFVALVGLSVYLVKRRSGGGSQIKFVDDGPGVMGPRNPAMSF